MSSSGKQFEKKTDFPVTVEGSRQFDPLDMHRFVKMVFEFKFFSYTLVDTENEIFLPETFLWKASH